MGCGVGFVVAVVVAVAAAVVVAVPGAAALDAAERSELASAYPLDWAVPGDVAVLFGDGRDKGWLDSESSLCSGPNASSSHLVARLCGDAEAVFMGGRRGPSILKAATMVRTADADAGHEMVRLAPRMLSAMAPSKWYVTQLLAKRGLKSRRKGPNPTARAVWVRVGLPAVPTGDFPLEGYGTLASYQIINRIPGLSTHMNKKDAFADAIAAAAARAPGLDWAFHPRTFVLPRDADALAADAASRGETGDYIVKPVHGGRGQGIFVVPGSRVVAEAPLDGEWLVQQYIGNPLTVLSERKFSMRMYVLITSVTPLRVYVARQSVAKFAALAFEATAADDPYADASVYAHITNNAANSHNEGFHISDDPSVDSVGMRRSLTAVMRQLGEAGADVPALQAAVDDVLVKAVLAVEPIVADLQAKHVRFPNNTYALLGVDVDLDSELKPWVIEANVNPSLGPHAAFERTHKDELLNTVFDMVGLTPFDAAAYKAAALAPGLHARCAGADAGAPWCAPSVLPHVVDLEYENAMNQAGLFARVFPAPDTGATYLDLGMGGAAARPIDAAILDYISSGSEHTDPTHSEL